MNHLYSVRIAGDFLKEDVQAIQQLVVEATEKSISEADIVGGSIDFLDELDVDELTELLTYLRERGFSYDIYAYDTCGDRYYVEYYRAGDEESEQVSTNEDFEPLFTKDDVISDFRRVIEAEKAYTGAAAIALLEKALEVIPPLPKARIVYPKEV